MKVIETYRVKDINQVGKDKKKLKQQTLTGKKKHKKTEKTILGNKGTIIDIFV